MSKEKNKNQGKLIICATPIGNLGDITHRCVDAFESADVVFAEDTRVSAKLLAALGVKTRIERLDETLMSARAKGVIDRVRSGEVVAYCSDAGMPGISDPGLRLVAAAREAGVAVEVLPGASALTTAYVSSGFSCPRFYFHGFFPRKTGERLRLLDQLKSLDACLVFYESPKRLTSALKTIEQTYPCRRVCVCRELTKRYEEVLVGLAGEVFETFDAREKTNNIKGEIVMVIDAPSKLEQDEDAQNEEIQAHTRACALLKSGLRNSEIVKHLTREFNVSRNVAYDIVLQEQKENEQKND